MADFPSDFEARFDGIGRLYSREGLGRLRTAHVCIIGIGGVGTWAAEALARSAVGRLTLVDLDEVCLSNVNRQAHSLTETVGRAKVAVMAERIHSINPECQVTAEQTFFNEQTAVELLAPAYTLVLDAMDSVTNKALLLARCRERGIPVIACGAAGGRRDGTQVRRADLAGVTHDRLLAGVRKKLRREFQFPADGSQMGIECIFSAELPVFAQPDGSVCAERAAAVEGTRLDCNGGLGSATFVTGAFGFAAAGLAVEKIALAGVQSEPKTR